MLSMYKTNCCAFQEIGGLNGYRGMARAAMVAFCRENISKPVKYGPSKARENTIYSYYVFSAALMTIKGGSYGADFAEYIEKNELGKVLASPIEKNLAFHAEHWNQIWIWTPDHKAILAWWDKQPESKEKASLRPEDPGLGGGAICPRCKSSWYNHTGWTCKDGGTWPDRELVVAPIVKLGVVKAVDDEEIEEDEVDDFGDDDDDLDLEDEDE